METSNQARSKVSKPNKLHAVKKLLGNIWYFPIRLIARWRKRLALWREILAGEPEVCALLICCGHSFITGCMAFAALLSLETWGGFLVKSKDQLAEGTGEGLNGLKLGHSVVKEWCEWMDQCFLLSALPSLVVLVQIFWDRSWHIPVWSTHDGALLI